MNQRELNREVSRKTGETVATISQLGFVPLRGVPFEREPEDLIINWDEHELHRNVALVEQRQPLAVV